MAERRAVVGGVDHPLVFFLRGDVLLPFISLCITLIASITRWGVAIVSVPTLFSSHSRVGKKKVMAAAIQSLPNNQ